MGLIKEHHHEILPKNQQTDEGDEANDDQLEGVERCDRENIAKHDGLYIDRCW